MSRQGWQEVRRQSVAHNADVEAALPAGELRSEIGKRRQDGFVRFSALCGNTGMKSECPQSTPTRHSGEQRRSTVTPQYPP
jgi:hypothetical protein